MSTLTEIDTCQLVTEYAERFDSDNGDTLTEYIDRAVMDVYPPAMSKIQGVPTSRVSLRKQILTAIQNRYVCGIGCFGCPNCTPENY